MSKTTTPAAQPAAKKKSKLSAAAKREQGWGWLMVAPTIIGLLVLNMWPFIQTLYASFCEHLGFGHYKFIGLDNYITMFQSADFWKATWNTIYFCILTVPVGIFLALLVAMLLNAKIKGKGFFRTVFFLPMVCAPAAVTMVWRWIFNSEYGILNELLGTNINWITDTKVVMITCAIVAIWSNVGYDAVLLLSGLQNISKSYYEAAEIDGASKLTQFFQITLPMASPTIFVVLIMRLMASLKVYDLIYMMVDTSNPALTSVQSLIYLFYRESFVSGNRGYGSAIVIWTVALIGIVTAIQFIGQKKWVNYDV
jgi:multiple sugar transport system permease protein